MFVNLLFYEIREKILIGPYQIISSIILIVISISIFKIEKKT